MCIIKTNTSHWIREKEGHLNDGLELGNVKNWNHCGIVDDGRYDWIRSEMDGTASSAHYGSKQARMQSLAIDKNELAWLV